MGKYDEASLMERAKEYQHKARVLRQIQSGKHSRTRVWNNTLNYSTITISALVTFSAFFGVKNLHALFLTDYIAVERLDFLFNFFILLLLIASFLQMTLNLGEKALGHLGSIRELTNFLTDLDDLFLEKELNAEECRQRIERLNFRYASINNVLPANSDTEWKKAKSALSEKSKS